MKNAIELLRRIEELDKVESAFLCFASDNSGDITVFTKREEICILTWDSFEELDRIIVTMSHLDNSDFKHFMERKIW